MKTFAMLMITPLLAVTTLAAETPSAAPNWRPLLDSNLTQWQTYLGYPNAETPVADLPRDAEGNYAEPIGYNRDERGVFTVVGETSEPVLRISGEIYGGIYTRDTFGDYHLKLQMKWGNKKWPPREELPLDTGILYHANGEHGVDYWRAWPLSQEFQVIEAGVEGTTGDWWKIAHGQIDIRCHQPTPDAPYIYSPTVPKLTFGGNDGADITCRASHNNEHPRGEWNTLELITHHGRSLHIVNGEVVMALSDSAYPAGGEIHPLENGHIVLQSEAGEAFFRNIEIRSIDRLPAQYRRYFDE